MSLTNAAENLSETESQALTDGFHLVIDALKLNDINTIYGVPGIPITDLGRLPKPRVCGSFHSAMNNMRGMRRLSPAI